MTQPTETDQAKAILWASEVNQEVASNESTRARAARVILALAAERDALRAAPHPCKDRCEAMLIVETQDRRLHEFRERADRAETALRKAKQAFWAISAENEAGEYLEPRAALIAQRAIVAIVEVEP